MIMNNKRHTDFYIPVLKVLENMKPHEINQLIEEVADFCQLSEEDRKVMTKGETNLKYRSHIQWAVTDLRQAGYIERTERGVNKISFEGMLMLEDNPENPTRDYLYQKSEKFRDFVNRKGTRSKNKETPILFDDDLGRESQDDKRVSEEIPSTQNNSQNEERHSELKSLYELRDKMKEMGFNTKEIDDKIEKVKSTYCLDKIKPIIGKTITELGVMGGNKYIVLIDNSFGKGPTAYICTDTNKLITLSNRIHPILDIYDEKIILQEIHFYEKSNSIESEKMLFLKSNIVKLFDKKVGKSFINTGVTVPRESVRDLERILGVHIEKGKSIDYKVSFYDIQYDCRIANVNIQTLKGGCYQIYWKGRAGISEALKKYFRAAESSATKFNPSFVEFYIDSESKCIIIKPK